MLRRLAATVLAASALAPALWAVRGLAQQIPGPETALPAPDREGGMTLHLALAARRSQRAFTGQDLTDREVGQLCWAAQGITQESTGYRTAPSGQHLYPVVLYVVNARGAHEYIPKGHLLKRVRDTAAQADLRRAAGQPSIVSAPVSLVVALNMTAMEKAGPNAEKFAFLEAGHVAQNVLLEATALGLASVPAGGVDEASVSRALQLPSGFRVAYVMPVGHPAAQ